MIGRTLNRPDLFVEEAFAAISEAGLNPYNGIIGIGYAVSNNFRLNTIDSNASEIGRIIARTPNSIRYALDLNILATSKQFAPMTIGEFEACVRPQMIRQEGWDFLKYNKNRTDLEQLDWNITQPGDDRITLRKPLQMTF